MDNIRIAGTGSYLPSATLTNKELVEQLAKNGIESSDEWIVTHTGIRERHIASPCESTSDMGYNAARIALDRAGLAATDVDLIICATSTPDMYLPSTACIIQGKLGANNAAAMDVNAACSGFIYAMATAFYYLKASGLRTAVVIAADTYSRIVDWKDRASCVFFGDGAGAVVLTKDESEAGIRGIYLGADGTNGSSIMAPACGISATRPASGFLEMREGTPKFSMRGHDVYNFAIAAFPHAVTKLLEQVSRNASNIDLLISHQANINIIRESLSRLGIPESKTYVNLDRYGNTAAASIPIALDEALISGRAEAGSGLLLVGFGGGLTWGAAFIDM